MAKMSTDDLLEAFKDLRYDHNMNPRLFAFGTGDFSTNALQNLDLRSIIGGGLGWHPIKSPQQTLDILAGLVWTHETYSPTPTNSFAALDLGEQYTRKLGTKSLFTEQAYLYPDLNQMDQFQLSVDSSFSTKLGKIFNWQTTFSDRYTSFPPPGTLSNDVILTTGLGLTLSRPQQFGAKPITSRPSARAWREAMMLGKE